MPLDDAKTYELLQRAETIGVFQLEGGPMRALIRSLAPTSFEDVAALVALYRPGPMAANMHNDYADRKNGRKPVEHLHPDAEEILGDTWGLMIYQESMMRVARSSPAIHWLPQTTFARPAGRRTGSSLPKSGPSSSRDAKPLDMGLSWANSGSTSSSRLQITPSTAATHSAMGTSPTRPHSSRRTTRPSTLPRLLTSVKANLDKAAIYLAECRTMGISVEVPDINRSESDFTPVVETDDAGEQRLSIIFGLSAVRNVGEGLVAHIVAEREANGPYADFYDFCQRVDTQVLNKRTVESLIKAGAFDDVGHLRKGLLTVFEQIVDHTVARRRERDMGIMTLFGGATTAARRRLRAHGHPRPRVRQAHRLAFEKEMLGLYVSDHPLLGAEAALSRRTDGAIDELDSFDDGAMKSIGGVITGLQRKWTRKGDLMAVFALEDLRSSVEVMVFPARCRSRATSWPTTRWSS